MRSVLIALVLYAVYEVTKSLQTAQSLSMRIRGLIPTIRQGQLILTLKTQVINKLHPITLNSFRASVYLNGEPVGQINYFNNDLVPTGVSEILIPVQMDVFEDTTRILNILDSQGLKDISVNGYVTIDSIELPYNNEIINWNK